MSFLRRAGGLRVQKLQNNPCAHCAMSRPNLPLIRRPWSGWHWTLDNACDTLSRLDFCPAICTLTIFSLSVSDWDTGYFAPNLDCCVTRCELLMTRCRWLVYCVAVWPPHQCSDLVWWNSPEILINGIPSSTQRCIQARGWLRNLLVITKIRSLTGSGQGWSYL